MGSVHEPNEGVPTEVKKRKEWVKQQDGNMDKKNKNEDVGGLAFPGLLGVLTKSEKE
ncbi:hypothetical protein M0804_011094 [Polistes exclamans]|nr:hypothetical protein M0804_011094 [Polistes exclamans]